MKRIGILGGMSWESSIEYERIMNTAVRERLEDLGCPLFPTARLHALAAVEAALAE